MPSRLGDNLITMSEKFRRNASGPSDVISLATASGFTLSISNQVGGRSAKGVLVFTRSLLYRQRNRDH
jgi:hypothetical protein